MTQIGTTLAPDTLVEGKYRIQHLLAEGGMGAVYHAVQEPLGRDVALKILKQQDDAPARRAQREKRFFREAAVCGKLTHPNTIMILDYGKLPDQQGFFLVMEFLEGQSLRELLIERGSLGTRVTMHIAMQMASSLADAHKQGAIHRDLKPPNVMLVARGEDPYFVKVVDFGLVKELEPEDEDEELTAENHLVGSPMYMAPERFLSADADLPVVDVYSLGIMIYEMLVGRPPFVRESDSTLQHIMMKHIQDEVPLMHELRPDLELPDGLEDLVMACLAKHPDDRIQTMEGLLTLLKTVAGGAGMSVAAVVEDTGAFVPPSGLSRQSGALATIRDAGPQTHVDTEQGSRPAKSVILWAVGAIVVALTLVAIWASQNTSEKTHVVVNSSPSGATVRLGERALGATPYDGPIELEEPVTITVEKDGFEPFEYRVLPKPGEEVMIEAKLTSIPVPPKVVAPPAAQPTVEPEEELVPAAPEKAPNKPPIPKKENKSDIKMAR